MLKVIITAALIFASQLAGAGPIPALTTAADSSTFGAQQINNVELMNVASATGQKSVRSRVNAWGGVFKGAYLGNYRSDGNAPANNERWTFEIFADGRFRIKAEDYRDLCVKHYPYEDFRDPKAGTKNYDPKKDGYVKFGGGRVVRLAACDATDQDQFFFVQSSKKMPDPVTGFPIGPYYRFWVTKKYGSLQSYVIRAISEPTQCLSTSRSNAAIVQYSPLVMSDCAPVGDGKDRWYIGKGDDMQDAHSASVLRQMVDVFSVYFYHRKGTDGSSAPLYLKTADVKLVPGTFKRYAVGDYDRLWFQSPFNAGDFIDRYDNYTTLPQSFEVRKWHISTFTQSLTLNGEVKISIFTIGSEGKFEWVNSDQTITGATMTLAPGLSGWFTAQKYFNYGEYSADIETDIGDKWSIAKVKAKFTGPNAIVVCDSASAQPACTASKW